MWCSSRDVFHIYIYTFYTFTCTSILSDFEIEPLDSGSVVYDESTHIVTFDSPPSSSYCARIDIHDNGEWFNYLPCAPTESGEVKIDSNQNVDRMRVALCLETRTDVCSEPTMAVIGKGKIYFNWIFDLKFRYGSTWGQGNSPKTWVSWPNYLDEFVTTWVNLFLVELVFG